MRYPLLYILFCLLPFISYGQHGSIVGRVWNNTLKRPIHNAFVKVAGIDAQLTDTAGYYNIRSLPKGCYNIVVSCPNYDTQRISGVRVDGRVVTLNIRLQPTDYKSIKTVEYSLPKGKTLSKGCPEVISK